MLRNQSCNNPYAPLLNYLTDHEILVLRQVNNKLREAITRGIKGPYVVKSQFIVANSGFFYHRTFALSAWDVYQKTTFSSSPLSAVLYALSERALLNATVFPAISQGESLDDTGRKYTPSSHCWPVNAAWMLAQIHKGRSFAVVTEYPGVNNVFRRGGDFSALTKEIATAFKAGYTVSRREFVCQRSVVILSPSSSSVVITTTLSLSTLKLTKSDCEEAVEKMRQEKDRVEGREAGKELNALFKQVEKSNRYGEYSLEDMQLEFFKSLARLTNKIAIEGFLETFDQLRIFNKKIFDLPSGKRITPECVLSCLSAKFIDVYEAAMNQENKSMAIFNIYQDNVYLKDKDRSISLIKEQKIQNCYNYLTLFFARRYGENEIIQKTFRITA